MAAIGPSTEELLRAAKRLCGVTRPAEVLERITQGLTETLQAARGDTRMPPVL